MQPRELVDQGAQVPRPDMLCETEKVVARGGIFMEE